jgi:predicted HD phosphohydrolase
MLDNYVFKLRRDFSSVFVPGSCFAPQFKRKKQNRKRAFDRLGYSTVGHAVGCDCDGCIADHALAVKLSDNDSVNGYQIRSRSKHAIRSAANSIFYRTDNKSRLRFITFTFPPLPASAAVAADANPKVQEDKFLHKLFKKFLDNERKNYSLKTWLWTNERQSGERLESHEKVAREVLHYHCIFDYENPVNYYLVNLRFLRLLHRNEFNILSSHSLAVKKGSADYSRLKLAYQAIVKGDYDYFMQDTERMYFRDELGIKRFMFLCPVDFEKIRYSSMDISQLSSYISKYISKSSDKVYCRRWGSSQGLVVSEEQLQTFVKDNLSEEVVDTDTGEIQSVVSQEKMLQFFTLGDKDAKILKFEIKINDKPETLYYIPPNWTKWSHHSELRKKFMQYFCYKI